MRKGKFIAFLFLVLVWMPGCFAVYMWWLSGQKEGVRIFVGCAIFIYAIFMPNIIHSFWGEFADLFRRTGKRETL